LGKHCAKVWDEFMRRQIVKTIKYGNRECRISDSLPFYRIVALNDYLFMLLTVLH
jgi:hypothetical protein